MIFSAHTWEGFCNFQKYASLINMIPLISSKKYTPNCEENVSERDRGRERVARVRRVDRLF